MGWASRTVCPVETSTRSTPASAKARAILTASSPVMPPSAQSVAEMRTDIGFFTRQTPRNAPNTPTGKRGRAGRRAAIFVGALVGERRDETRQQIAVGAMQLQHVEAAGFAALGGLNEGRLHRIPRGAVH